MSGRPSSSRRRRASDVPRLEAGQRCLLAAFSWALESGELHAATSTLIATMLWFVARGRYAEGLEMCERLVAAGVSDEDRSIVAFTELMFASHGRLSDDMLERIRRDIGMLPRSSHPWLALPADGYIAAMSIVAGDPSSVERAVAACRAAADAARSAQPTVRNGAAAGSQQPAGRHGLAGVRREAD